MRVKSVPDVKFCLVFQCETLSVPVMRRVLGDTLRRLGMDSESVYDLVLAATEACTNVLNHGGREVREFAVVTSLGAVGCQVQVADEGAGAVLQETGLQEPGLQEPGLQEPGLQEPGLQEPGPPAPREPSVPDGPDEHQPETAIAQLPESGRGLAVMRAVVDNVTLDTSPGRGTVVTMRKHIKWPKDAPLRQYRAAS